MTRVFVSARWAALCCLFALGVPISARAQEALRRFAIIAGNNEGGTDTRPLLYARDDARKIYDILLRVGGVRNEDAALVLNQSADAFLTILNEMEKRVTLANASGQKTALLVYYSGHAKDGALRMGKSQLVLEFLRQRLSQSPAHIRLAVFDACRSGMIIRTKGARRAPEFEVRIDSSRDARGLVILTSSAADEDSQESDLLRGSYFSHHLSSALLGDADKSGDGRVTLSEAYAYAYQRTVADTAESTAGAQHPTFSYDLAGNGDLILTDIAKRQEGLNFTEDLPPATYFVVDDNGFIAAEVIKEPGLERRIALAPGSYRIKRRLTDRLQIAQVRVVAGKLTPLSPPLLKDVPFSDDPVKGVFIRGPERTAFGLYAGYQSFLESGAREGLFPAVPMYGIEMELRSFLRRDWVWGFDVALGVSRPSFVVLGDSFQGRYTQLNAGTTLGVDWTWGGFHVFTGARIVALWMTRSFETASVPSQAFLTFSPGAVLGLQYRWRHMSFQLRGRMHYLYYNQDALQSRALGFWDAGAVVGYEL